MKRETRLNLIFLVVLLLVVAPGGVILFRKKSMPGERAIGSPDPVRTTTAWIDPYPAESVPRLAPVQALQWVGALSSDGTPGPATRVVNSVAVPLVGGEAERKTPGHVGEAVFYGTNPSGSAAAQVMSTGRWFQVVSRGPVGTAETFFRVVIWNEDTTPDDGKFTASITRAGGEIPATVTNLHTASMPLDIRHDLQNAGYVMPPRIVTFFDLVVPNGEVSAITIRFDGKEKLEQTAALPRP